MRARFFMAFAIFAAALALVVRSLTAPDGGAVFKRENCDKCHVLRGEGLGVIDLAGVADERSRAWLRDHIRDARLHDPRSGMPRFGHLSDREMDALIDYIAEEEPRPAD